MEKIKLKHILIASLSPVIALSIGICVYQSLKRGSLDLVGIVVGIYYFIPAVLFTLGYVALQRWMSNSVPFFLSLIGQLTLSLVLVLLLLTLWIVFEGSPYDYRGMDFSVYWVKEVKRYWWPMAYFGVTIPIILKFITRNRKSNGQ